MKYQNRKNGKVAELVSTNEKFKTVRLRYEDGTERDYTTATLGKSFKKLVEEAPVAVEQPVVEQKETVEVPIIVDDPVADEVVTKDDVHIGEAAPIDVAQTWFNVHGIKFDRSRDGMRVFTADGIRYCEIWKRKKSVRMYINADADRYVTLDKKFIERETVTAGAVSKRYNISVYVPVDNIDSVFTHLFM